MPHESLSPEAWGAISTIISALAAAGATVTAALIATVRRDARGARVVAEETRAVAEEARDLSRPTGNGWAGDTMAALARIERQQAATHRQVRGLMRQQVRTRAVLVGHLADHAQSSAGEGS